MLKRILLSGLTLVVTSLVQAAPANGKAFDRVMIVIFENTNYSAAMNQPFFHQLATQGVNFSNFLALTHPSQGNYIGLTSGSLGGVHGDSTTNIDATNIVDLLEAHGLTWKVYAEDYPGNCFTGATSGNYARKHNPLISYLNIQKSAQRCANIVNANQLDTDIQNGNLPNYVMYIPNIKNDGHDTGIAYGNRWYSTWLPKYLANENFMKSTVVLTTFDESGSGPVNQIYTSIVGSMIKPATVSTSLNIFSLLRFIEENWSLGNLGREDVNAPAIPYIWK